MDNDSLFLRRWSTARFHGESSVKSRSFMLPPREERNTFFNPASARFQLAPTPLSRGILNYPYGSEQSFVKHRHLCSNKAFDDTTPRWSSTLVNPFNRRKTDVRRTHLDLVSTTTPAATSSAEEQIDEETTVTQKSGCTPTSGKRTRTAFTPVQLLVLETAFEKNHYVVGHERKQLAMYLKLSETQVKVWFQNRRTKWKKTTQRPCGQMVWA